MSQRFGLPFFDFKVELPAGFQPSIIMSFDSIRAKVRALAQLQHNSRFNFLEDKGLLLDCSQLTCGERSSNHVTSSKKV